MNTVTTPLRWEHLVSFDRIWANKVNHLEIILDPDLSWKKKILIRVMKIKTTLAVNTSQNSKVRSWELVFSKSINLFHINLNSFHIYVKYAY